MYMFYRNNRFNTVINQYIKAIVHLFIKYILMNNYLLLDCCKMYYLYTKYDFKQLIFT